ncbi:MAG TPA: hypothetical protein VFF06_26985 [Polyangia bacterium]|nr:hypothetical protein [Polyangia bacterium]
MKLAEIFALALAAAGCGDSGPAAFDAAAPDLTVAADAAIDLQAMCGPPSTDAGVCLNTVSGKLVDDSGAGIPNLVTSVCAVACYFGMTDATGAFSNPVYDVVEPDFYAFEAHGRPDRASFYVRLPPLVGMSATYAQPLLLPSLPMTGPLIALDQSAQTLTSGDVTLTLAQGTKVMLSVEDVVLMDHGRQLRALTVSPPTKMAFVDPASPPDALFGFAPFEVAFSQKAQLSFRNIASIPANAAVDVLEMGGLVGATPPAGNFAKVATAHVTADGTSVVMDTGEGVTGLTWIALRKQ